MFDKVLVVDDEPKAVSEMVGFLERRGLKVAGTSDPRAALVAIVVDESLRAVITDLKMPHVDGFRILEAANDRRQKGRLESIVAITGHATLEDEKRARECGAMHFFQKPLDLRQVLQALRPVASVVCQ